MPKFLIAIILKFSRTTRSLLIKYNQAFKHVPDAVYEELLGLGLLQQSFALTSNLKLQGDTSYHDLVAQGNIVLKEAPNEFVT